MEKKTIGLIATIGTAFLCACPGLCLCLWGFIGISGTPIDQTLNGQTTSEPMSTGLAVSLLCLSLIAIAIPIIVGFFTLRNTGDDVIDVEPVSSPEPAASAAPIIDDEETLPPTS
ncbi:MAG: hypothetical protein HN392_13445 [Anaerolineae bacterium]|jgi:hypothetical protein|nr:hypothetical protein [Anaerolineae bacterium]MBT7783871.1 hypothetical protein [Anaerolineae bacterium]